ncbi:MAG: Coq4 family protein [Candidatus Azotimanducaceae bacterium]
MPDDTKRHMQPIAAYRALRALLKDPDKTEEVFIIIRAMSGNSLGNCYKQFRKTRVGKEILAEKRQLLSVLQDRTKLAGLSAESLGRRYLDFIEREGIYAKGLVDASDEAIPISNPELRLYAERTRDMHDLWHVITGYGRDTFGEACLLAFTYAQTRNRGVGIIALVGFFKLRKEIGSGVGRAMWQGYQAGRRASWLPAQDWEKLLCLSIREVRRQLNIEEPTKYSTKFTEMRNLAAI